MMDQDKKESSNWGWFVVAVLVYGTVVALLNGAATSEWRAEIREAGKPQNSVSLVEDPKLFQLVRATGDHKENTCWFVDTTLFDEKVTIIYSPYDPITRVNGRWDAASNTIELMSPEGFSVDTIAHEVSHMVDTFMAQRPDLDPHYEAYMQGYWTDCVYQILLHDLSCTEDPWCNLE